MAGLNGWKQMSKVESKFTPEWKGKYYAEVSKREKVTGQVLKSTAERVR
ncbi:hypothetical protein [Sphingobacterium anhuiense]|uniref:Uncharacterized protein n=1 Tax=Sphingobacterium anhuiense TaxID=493780 RepID=A0ABW5YPN7_9SPHI